MSHCKTEFSQLIYSTCVKETAYTYLHVYTLSNLMVYILFDCLFSPFNVVIFAENAIATDLCLS